MSDTKNVVRRSVLSPSVPRSPESSLVQLLEKCEDQRALVSSIRRKVEASSPSSPPRYNADESKLLFDLFSAASPRRTGGAESGCKRFDYVFAGSTATTAANVVGVTPFVPAEGTDYNQRLGKSVRLLRTSIHITGEFIGSSIAFSGYQNPIARFVILLDKMAPLSNLWADDAVPPVSTAAVVQTYTAGSGALLNTVAPFHYVTEGARYHHIYDEKIVPQVGSNSFAIVAGLNQVYQGIAHKTIEIDWRGAVATFAGTAGNTPLVNEMLYWMIQDSGGASTAPFNYGNSMTTWFEDRAD